MKKLAVLFILVLFASCTSDSESNVNNQNMTGFKIDHNSSPGYHFVTNGTLLNGKLYSETQADILNGVAQPEVTQQMFFYNADGTVNHYVQHSFDYDRMIYLHYDANQKLIGAELTINESVVYYRFRHISDEKVVFERTNTPYNDPNAIAGQSIVLQFNSNDDVISAGLDTNSDNIADSQVNTFAYSNHNMSSAVFWDGNIVNFSYSNIIDNFIYLREKSFGKKNLRIIDGECYHVLYNSDYFYPNLSVSKNILEEEAALSTFRLLPNNFYELKTEINDGQTTTTQFFFE